MNFTLPNLKYENEYTEINSLRRGFFENILIYLEGTVLNKWGREDALDFKLQKMELLPEVD